jgi:3,4-dihydroxy 2-butanone 4-phosphate synthase/GTP cyclohydrolase II
MHYACAGRRVTVDLAHDVTTGISARDRTRTIAALGDPDAVAADFARPGHVMPVLTHRDGILAQPGPGEAAVDLAVLAGCGPAAGFDTIVGLEHPTKMVRGPELDRFAAEHDLVLVTIADLVSHRRRTAALARSTAGAATIANGDAARFLHDHGRGPAPLEIGYELPPGHGRGSARAGA